MEGQDRCFPYYWRHGCTFSLFLRGVIQYLLGFFFLTDQKGEFCLDRRSLCLYVCYMSPLNSFVLQLLEPEVDSIWLLLP